MAGIAIAWQQPTLTALCAPDANHFAWKIHLANESDFELDGSFDSDFDPLTMADIGAGDEAFDELDFGSSGDHEFTTPRGGSTLYVRWSSDHGSKTDAAANEELCEQPSVEQSVAEESEDECAPDDRRQAG